MPLRSLRKCDTALSLVIACSCNMSCWNYKTEHSASCSFVRRKQNRLKLDKSFEQNGDRLYMWDDRNLSPFKHRTITCTLSKSGHLSVAVYPWPALQISFFRKCIHSSIRYLWALIPQAERDAGSQRTRKLRAQNKAEPADRLDLRPFLLWGSSANEIYACRLMKTYKVWWKIAAVSLIICWRIRWNIEYSVWLSVQS